MPPPAAPGARPFRFRDGLKLRAVEATGPGGDSRWISAGIAFALYAYAAVTAIDVLWMGSPTGGTAVRARLATVGVLTVAWALAFRGRAGLGAGAALAAVWVELHVGIWLQGLELAPGLVGLPVLVVAAGLLWGGSVAYAVATLGTVTVAGAAALGQAARGRTAPYASTEGVEAWVVAALAMFAAATLLTWGVAAMGRRLAASGEARRRLEELVDRSPDGVIATDRWGRIQVANPAARRLLDLPDDDLVGEDLESALARAEEGSAGDEYLRDLVEGRSDRVTVRLGEEPDVRWVEALRAELTGTDGVARVVLGLRDVTPQREALQEHRQLETRLEHALRMEAVARLAGGVAHNFNNLLTVIGGCAELLLDPEERVDELARDILEAKVRGAALTGQLLSFAQKDVVTLGLVSLSDLVRTMKPNLESFLTEGLRLALDVPGRTPAVMGDRGQIEQVIMNLVINAKDAIAGVGTVTVGVYPPGARRSWQTEEWEVPDGFVELGVNDDGVGMDPETRTRAFEPFFTTRPSGKGTGLGLSTVYGVVSQNGGEVRVLTRPGRGTAVVVQWPVASDREAA